MFRNARIALTMNRVGNIVDGQEIRDELVLLHQQIHHFSGVQPNGFFGGRLHLHGVRDRWGKFLLILKSKCQHKFGKHFAQFCLIFLILEFRNVVVSNRIVAKNKQNHAFNKWQSNRPSRRERDFFSLTIWFVIVTPLDLQCSIAVRLSFQHYHAVKHCFSVKYIIVF